MRKTHIGAAIVLIPVALWCLFWLVPNNTVPPTSEDDLSPALVPFIALGAMVFTGSLMLLRALRESTAAKRGADEEFGLESTGIDAGVLQNLLWFTVLSVVSWWLITYVGFEPAMTVMLSITMVYVGVRKPLTIALVALLMPITLSLCAWHFFSTEMPGFWR